VIACDTNILFIALEVTRPFHGKAREFLDGQRMNSGFALCELALLELYVLLRNPVLCRRPLAAPDAVGMIRALRSNPRWSVIDYPGPAPGIMEAIWRSAAERDFARRRVFDARLAHTLLHHRVTEFATTNVKGFEGFGFARLWNPLADS
jgi:toxin-antitoxin system PIN domain toxin